MGLALQRAVIEVERVDDLVSGMESWNGGLGSPFIQARDGRHSLVARASQR